MGLKFLFITLVQICISIVKILEFFITFLIPTFFTRSPYSTQYTFLCPSFLTTKWRKLTLFLLLLRLSPSQSFSLVLVISQIQQLICIEITTLFWTIKLFSVTKFITKFLVKLIIKLNCRLFLVSLINFVLSIGWTFVT